MKGPGLDGFSGVTGLPRVDRSEFVPADTTFEPDVIDVVSGLAPATIRLPVVVAVPLAAPSGAATPGAGVVGGGTAPNAATGARVVGPDPASPQQLSPGSPWGTKKEPPVSAYRAGYGDYLRDAGTPQVAALGMTGVVGMLIFTGFGGFVGYRQAMAGRSVRTQVDKRFIN